jgi:segregation and condensation protein A
MTMTEPASTDPTRALNAQAIETWEAPTADTAPLASEALRVDVDGFEGPLDLLLALARTQRVDLASISVLALVEQYLAFIADAQKLRLEIAADYLVMAAWLAFLKSRLLLPREAKRLDETSAEELAQRLAFRLMRLNAMRNAAAILMTRNRLGRDVFARGWPEGVTTIRETHHTAQIYDLLRAYADQRRRTIKVGHVVKARKTWSIKDARARLEDMVGESVDMWVQLDMFLTRFLPISADASTPPPDTKTMLASSFGATLEMTREGLLDLRQDTPFGPIHIRRRTTSQNSPAHET